MKGVSNWMIGLMVALIISACIMLVGLTRAEESVTDKVPRTKLTALSMRNIMTLVSTTELGLRYYHASEEFEVQVTDEFITVYSIKSVEKTEITLPHYVSNVVETDRFRGQDFCMVKKLDENCEPIIEVCPADDSVCCDMDPNDCLLP